MPPPKTEGQEQAIDPLLKYLAEQRAKLEQDKKAAQEQRAKEQRDKLEQDKKAAKEPQEKVEKPKKTLTYEQMVEREKEANRQTYLREQREREEKAKLEYFNKADKQAKEEAARAKLERERKIIYGDDTTQPPAAGPGPAQQAPAAPVTTFPDLSGRAPLEAFQD